MILATVWVVSAVSSSNGRRAAPWFFPLVFSLAALIHFRTFTAGTIHPDNLFMCHAMLTSLLCWRALASRSRAFALAALLAAAPGIWAKQTALMGFWGVTAALIASKNWTLRQLGPVIAIGAAAWLFCVGALWLPSLNRFYTLELLLNHPVAPEKFAPLIAQLYGANAFRMLLVFLFPLGLMRMKASESGLGSPFVLTWISLGFFEVLPAFAAYFKELGAQNNLGILDLWMFVGAAPLLNISPAVERPSEGFRHVQLGHRKWRLGPLRSPPLELFYASLLVLCLFPAQFLPESWLGNFLPKRSNVPLEEAHFQYGERFEEMIWRDLRRGNRVLIGHGTSVLIHNGILEIPLDRMNSALELKSGSKSELMKTLDRLRDGRYDRIYLPQLLFLNISWYGDAVQKEIEENWEINAGIPSVQTIHRESPPYGKGRYPVANWLMGEIAVYEHARGKRM